MSDKKTPTPRKEKGRNVSSKKFIVQRDLEMFPEIQTKDLQSLKKKIPRNKRKKNKISRRKAKKKEGKE